MDRLHALSQNKLFRDLTRDEVGRIADRVQQEAFPEGAEILRQSQPPDRIHLLVEGKVQVRRRLPDAEENVIAELAPGDFFGEMAVIIGAETHSSSIVATTPVTTFSIGAAPFIDLLTKYPAVMHNVLSTVILQLRGINNKWLETLRVEKQVLERKVSERTQELEEVGRRVSRELALAQNIQRNLLPEKRRTFPGIVIATDYIPCDELGGDITGVFQIDETRLGVYGGDVCGHGIYAAMVMSYVKKLIETSVKRILLNRQYVVKPPGAVLTAINQSFMAEISMGDPEIYLTLFLGVLDMRRLTFEYSSAGIHVPPLVISSGKAEKLFEQSDFPIGHMPDHEYATQRATLAPGDVFLFVSDGVIEARHGEEAFGMDRLKAEAERTVAREGCLDADCVLASVRGFLGDEPPQDDMCLLTISFDPSIERATGSHG
jgi:sigma-B regulation protein RsbU (phosphoserine phosphatase)